MTMDTIVAQASAPGRSGIAVVRISGPNVCACIEQLWPGSQLQPKRMNYAALCDCSGQVIDEGLWVYFAGPASYTGEDVLEFHGHGNPLLVDRVIGRFCELGCRLAEPGEFSKRAFLNDKMDLLQAEAVADLISAHSQQAIDLAFQSLQGVFSERIHGVVESLVELRVYLEATLDFSDEDIDFIKEGDVVLRVKGLLADIVRVKQAAAQGMLLQEGLKIVVVGPPNVGKSSLFNVLLGRNEAIVTSQAGTTRDALSQSLRLGDLVVSLTDTAGVRETDDQIELEGISRARDKIKHANLLLVMLDPMRFSNTDHHEFLSNIPDAKGKEVVCVLNKTDQLSEEELAKYQLNSNLALISTLRGLGIDELVQGLCDKAAEIFGSEQGIFLARRRHLEAISQAEEALKRGLEQLLGLSAGELLAEECRIAQDALGSITGQFTHDDLLTEIFSTFCIGK